MIGLATTAPVTSISSLLVPSPCISSGRVLLIVYAVEIGWLSLVRLSKVLITPSPRLPKSVCLSLLHAERRSGTTAKDIFLKLLFKSFFINGENIGDNNILFKYASIYIKDFSANDLNNNTDFLSSVSEGELICSATLIKKGRSYQLWECKMYHDENLCAVSKVRLSKINK